MANPEYTPSHETDPEKLSRSEALTRVVAEYLEIEDAAFIDEMDDEAEQVGYVYGRLLEQGEDPDTVLAEAGVTETEVDDEV